MEIAIKHLKTALEELKRAEATFITVMNGADLVKDNQKANYCDDARIAIGITIRELENKISYMTAGSEMLTARKTS